MTADLLELLKCESCGTEFYGKKDKDIYCHICKTILDLKKAFGLDDLIVAHVDFERVRDPRWDKTEKTHDWRNYIPEEVRNNWMQYPFEARVMAVMFAEDLARGEM